MIIDFDLNLEYYNYIHDVTLKWIIIIVMRCVVKWW
jgi:hypothetical protein